MKMTISAAKAKRVKTILNFGFIWIASFSPTSLQAIRVFMRSKYCISVVLSRPFFAACIPGPGDVK
jgi:hypothetical protein